MTLKECGPGRECMPSIARRRKTASGAIRRMPRLTGRILKCAITAQSYAGSLEREPPLLPAGATPSRHDLPARLRRHNEDLHHFGFEEVAAKLIERTHTDHSLPFIGLRLKASPISHTIVGERNAAELLDTTGRAIWSQPKSSMRTMKVTSF